MAGGHSRHVKQGPGPRWERHPRTIRSGQIFFPHEGARRRKLTVKRVERETVRAVREDQTERTYALDRLLAIDAEGNGLHYRFMGWKPRPRGYHTELRVVRVCESDGSCAVVLPEWDPGTEIGVPVASLPKELRVQGGVGSCMANLASATVAGLSLHGFRLSQPRGVSRSEKAPHPAVVAEGQRYRRREDGRDLLIVDDEQPRVSAWNGQRLVRVSAKHLLAVDGSGHGRFFEYRGGGVRATRRKIAAGRRSRARIVGA
jgi:hypothetical protein